MKQCRFLTVLAAVVFPFAAVFCPAQPLDTPQTPDPQATASADKIRQNLEETLKLISESKTPSSSDIAASQKLLDESKRHVGQFTEQQKARYILLQGWAAYFQNDLPKAYTSSAAACRLDQTDPDAWASQAAFALLLNKKPMTPRPPRPQPRQRTRPQEPTMDVPETYSPQGLEMQNSILKFDVRQLQLDLLEQKIKPFRLDCLNETTFDWEPADQALCILYWQKFPPERAATEPNEPSGPARRSPRARRPVRAPQPAVPADMPPMSEEGFGPGYDQADPLTVQAAAFARIIEADWLSQKRRFKFIAVNIDHPDYKAEIINEIIKRPQPWAQALAADQQPDCLPVKPDNAINPLLAIADTTGVVRYAGPADSFIVSMLLAQLAPASTTGPDTERQTEPVLPPAEPNVPPSDRRPAQQIQPASPQQPPDKQQIPQYREIALENQVQAEHLLAATEGLFMKVAQKRGMTYTNGVNFCRQIIKDYPGTEYAEKARQLLRQVPENQRARYNITDQELGL